MRRSAEPDFPDIADHWLTANSGLNKAQRNSLAAVATTLISFLDTDKKVVIGISGAPGSGKSTLARLLVHCLNLNETPACCLSLDDYYLGKEQRETLARSSHPLFARRGVPGTHDIEWLARDLDSIRRSSSRELQLPVFDKSIDDRACSSQWRSLEMQPKIIFLEGWLVGAPPSGNTDLDLAVNQLENRQDPDAAWRCEVFRNWVYYQEKLAGRLDELWYIRVPDWNCVIDWRWQQEQELAAPGLANRNGVEDFLGTFQRIVDQMQLTHAEWADHVLAVDRGHNIKLID